jgi:hypothetical protein
MSDRSKGASIEPAVQKPMVMLLEQPLMLTTAADGSLTLDATVAGGAVRLVFTTDASALLRAALGVPDEQVRRRRADQEANQR